MNLTGDDSYNTQWIKGYKEQIQFREHEPGEAISYYICSRNLKENLIFYNLMTNRKKPLCKALFLVLFEFETMRISWIWGGNHKSLLSVQQFVATDCNWLTKLSCRITVQINFSMYNSKWTHHQPCHQSTFSLLLVQPATVSSIQN